MADTQRFFTINQLGDMPPPRWLIDELFEANSLVMVAGPPASFKSFLVLDWLLCMACGRNWQGRKTEPSRVLYILGEGRASLLKRIQAWIQYNKLTPTELEQLNMNFKVTFEVPQMAIKPSVDNMLMELNKDGFSPDVIAIDTFARSFVGLDENSPKDVGLWVEQADRLRTLGFTVIFLHHTAKNTEFGVRYRGSTAIMGAMDTAMTMMRDPEVIGGVKLTVTKQKDHDEGDPLYLQRVVVTLPNSLDGSVVLIPTQRVDDRFTENQDNNPEAMMIKLIHDKSYEHDVDRASMLEKLFGGTEGQWKTRISRWKKEHMAEVQSVTIVKHPSSYIPSLREGMDIP